METIVSITEVASVRDSIISKLEANAPEVSRLATSRVKNDIITGNSFTDLSTLEIFISRAVVGDVMAVGPDWPVDDDSRADRVASPISVSISAGDSRLRVVSTVGINIKSIGGVSGSTEPVSSFRVRAKLATIIASVETTSATVADNDHSVVSRASSVAEDTISSEDDRIGETTANSSETVTNETPVRVVVVISI